MRNGTVSIICLAVIAGLVVLAKVRLPTATTRPTTQALLQVSGVGADSGDAGFAQQLKRRYIEAVRDSLTGVHLQTPRVKPSVAETGENGLEENPYDADLRKSGGDWPLYGLTMIGTQRLDNVWNLLESVLAEAHDVPGSFVECGVWRGGASIFARAVLWAHQSDREVHVVDSFQGLPPNTTAEDHIGWHRAKFLSVSREQVEAGFERYGLLDKAVHFHKGYFRYALPAWKAAGMGPIAVLRMDGDMYESTMDQLYNLYDQVSPGGYVIIDDWNIGVCQKAVKEFFKRHGLDKSIIQSANVITAFFQKPRGHIEPIDQSWYTEFNGTRNLDDAAGAAERRL